MGRTTMARRNQADMVLILGGVCVLGYAIGQAAQYVRVVLLLRRGVGLGRVGGARGKEARASAMELTGIRVRCRWTSNANPIASGPSWR